MTDPTALKRLPVAAVCDEHVRATPARSARSRTHIGPVLRPRRSRRRVGSASSRKLSVNRPMTPRSNAIARAAASAMSSMAALPVGLVFERMCR